MAEHTMADKIALYVGGGLVVLGVVGIGLLEMLLGASHPVQEDGQIIHDTLISMDVRAYVILLGLLVWGLYALYRLVGTTPEAEAAAAREPGTAD